MRRLERLNLLDKLGRALQARWSYSGIDEYLKACGIDTTKQTSNVNSKWVYSKELLADESDSKLLEIADELGISHGYVSRLNLSASDSKFWRPGHFRLFISHISEHKAKAAMLQKVLLEFGISSFVAHEDIEPTKEWLVEIEKALLSMDALVAILTPGFKESNWTDQEIGFAVGRDVLIIPVRKGLDPYGFIARYQGLQGAGLTVRQVAEAMQTIIAQNAKTKGKYADVAVKLILEASNPEQVLHWITTLEAINAPPVPALEYLQAHARESRLIDADPGMIKRINAVLASAGLSEIAVQAVTTMEFEDDIPF